MTRRPSLPPRTDPENEVDRFSPEVRCGGPKPMKRSPPKKVPSSRHRERPRGAS